MGFIIILIFLFYHVLCTDVNIIESPEANHFYSHSLHQRYSDMSILSYNNLNKLDNERLSPEDVICFTHPFAQVVPSNGDAVYFYPLFISKNASNSLKIFQSFKLKPLMKEYSHVNKLVIISENTNNLKDEIVEVIESKNKQNILYHIEYETITDISQFKSSENPTETTIILDLFLDFKMSYKMINLRLKYKIKNKYYRLFPIPEYDYNNLIDEDDENGVYMLYNYIDNNNEKYIIQPKDYYLNEMYIIYFFIFVLIYRTKFIDLYIMNKDKYNNLNSNSDRNIISNQFSIIQFIKKYNNRSLFKHIHNIIIHEDDNNNNNNIKNMKDENNENSNDDEEKKENIKYLILLTEIKNDDDNNDEEDSGNLQEDHETDLITEFKSQVNSLNDIIIVSEEKMIFKPKIINITNDKDCLNTLKEYYENENEILLIINGNNGCYNEVFTYENNNKDNDNNEKIVWLNGIVDSQLLPYSSQLTLDEISNIYYSGIETSTIDYILFKFILLNHYNDIRNSVILYDSSNDNMFEWFDEFSLDKPNKCQIKAENDINRCLDIVENKNEENNNDEDNDEKLLVILNIENIETMKKIMNNINNNNYTVVSINPCMEYNDLIQFENITFFSLMNVGESKYSTNRMKYKIFEIKLIMTIVKDLIIKDELSNYKFRLKYDKYIYQDKNDKEYSFSYKVDINNFITNKFYICKNINRNENIRCEETRYLITLSKKKYEDKKDVYFLGGFFNFNKIDELSLLFIYLHFMDDFNVENKYNYFYPVVYNINFTLSSSLSSRSFASQLIGTYFDIIQKYKDKLIFLYIGQDSNNILYLNDYIINNGSKIMHLYPNIINGYNCSSNIIQSGMSMLGGWWSVYRDMTKYPFSYITMIIDSVYSNNVFFVEYLSLFSKLLPLHIYYYYRTQQQQQRKMNDLYSLLNDCFATSKCDIVSILDRENSLFLYQYFKENNIQLSYHKNVTFYDIKLNENFFLYSELDRMKDIIPDGIVTVSNYFPTLLNYSSPLYNINKNYLSFIKTSVNEDFIPNHITTSFYNGLHSWKSNVMKTSSFDPKKISIYSINKQTESPSGIIRKTEQNYFETNMYINAIDKIERIESYKIIDIVKFTPDIHYFVYYNLLDNSFNNYNYYCKISKEDENEVVTASRSLNLDSNSHTSSSSSDESHHDFYLIYIGVILDGNNRFISQSILYYIESILIELNNYKSHLKVSIYPYLLSHKDLDDGIALSNMFTNDKIKVIFGCISEYCYYKLLPYFEKEEKIFITLYKPFKMKCKKNIFYIQQPEYNLISTVLSYYKSINYTKLYYLYDGNNKYINGSVSIDEIQNIYKEKCLDYQLNISFIQYDNNNSNTLFRQMLREKDHVGLIVSLKEKSLEDYTEYSRLLKLSSFQFSHFILYSIITNNKENGNISDNSNIMTILPQIMVEYEKVSNSNNNYNNNPLKNLVEISLNYIISAFKTYDNYIHNKKDNSNYDDKDYLIKAFETIEFGFITTTTSSIDSTITKSSSTSYTNNNNNNNNNNVNYAGKGSISHILILNYNFAEIKSNTILYYEDPINIADDDDDDEFNCHSSDIKSYYQLNTTYYVIFFSFHFIYILFILSFIVFVYVFRKSRIIKASSSNMMIYIGLAIYNSILASYLWYFVRYSDFTCSFFTCYWIVGIQNIISALDLKTWRIDKLLYNPLLKKFHISDYYVYSLLMVSLLGHIIMDIIWYLIDPFSKYNERLLIDESNSIELVYFRSCSFSYSYVIIHLVYVILFYIYGLYESWRTIEVDKEFNESQSLSTIVSCLSYASVTMLIMYNYTYNDPIAVGLLLMIIYPMALIISEILLWFPKFYYLYNTGFAIENNNNVTNNNNNNNGSKNSKCNYTSKDNRNTNMNNMTNMSVTENMKSRRSSVHCHVFGNMEDAATSYILKSSRKRTYSIGDELHNYNNNNNNNNDNNNTQMNSTNNINNNNNNNNRRRVSSYGRLGGGLLGNNLTNTNNNNNNNEMRILPHSRSGFNYNNNNKIVNGSVGVGTTSSYSFGGGLLVGGMSLNGDNNNNILKPVISGPTKILIPLPGSTSNIYENNNNNNNNNLNVSPPIVLNVTTKSVENNNNNIKNKENENEK